MKKFEAVRHWTTEFSKHGCFNHINHIMAFDEWQGWASCKALQTLLPYDVKNLNGKFVEFVEQKPSQDYSAVAYEEYIFESGKVPTRNQSWHDLFGAFIWCLFPQTKAKINQLHYNDIKTHGTKERTKQRNALTLFDECGVVLATKNQTLLSALREHRWRDAFVEMRNLWFDKSEQGVATYNFGHANYEMLTNPFIGLTGKWLVLDTSAEISSLPLNVQYRLIDERLCQQLENGVLNDNSNMSPLPLLGIPGWYDKNIDDSFYDNQEYFRPKRG
ncbi:MAG: DUF3025 domain-containing protein [Gammaproteobacteria bacterium]|nr:DUF3025 domain-containing protein [Gammaproteobacteria bacterium]